MFAPAPKKPPWRIGVLPFQRITRVQDADDWPMAVQMILVDQLNGVEDLRVIDPFTLGNLAGSEPRGSPLNLASARQLGASFLVNGTIETVDT
jgi:TolB-like protein